MKIIHSDTGSRLDLTDKNDVKKNFVFHFHKSFFAMVKRVETSCSASSLNFGLD